MADEMLKEQNVELEAEEKDVAGAGLEPCECDEEETLDQSYPPTHHKKDDCFCLRVYGKTLEAILEAQKQILWCSPPVASSADELTALQATCRQPTSCPPGFQGRYTVRPGDTMFLIARRFGVSLQALINANPHITNPNLIFPCDVLCVPGAQDCRVPTSCPPGFKGRYTVRPGDTMFLIARRFGVSLQALINANPHITNPNLIFPCDVLCVPQARKSEENDEEEEEE